MKDYNNIDLKIFEILGSYSFKNTKFVPFKTFTIQT